MQIREILDIMGIDCDEYRIHLWDYDFENNPIEFNFQLPKESYIPWDINMPNTDSTVVYANCKKYESDYLGKMLDRIHEKVPGSELYSDEIVYTVFAILHEIGHLWNYRDKRLTKEEYIREEAAERERVLNIENDEICFIEYRNLPNEKAADEIAFNCMLEILERIKSWKENK